MLGAGAFIACLGFLCAMHAAFMGDKKAMAVGGFLMGLAILTMME